MENEGGRFMGKLQCDICGGTLVMQSGGQSAVCDSCGMQYSVERVREKVREIRGVVSVEGTVRTQDADFIIRGGVLERYNGNDVHVVIPDSVVKIGEKAFEGCAGIQSVTFPPNVIEIGNDAFSDCQSLNDIKLSNALVKIGRWSFRGCCSLKRVNLPESVRTIGNWAFNGCTSLEVINIPDQVGAVDRWAELYGAFENCPALREVIISETQKETLFIYESSDGMLWSGPARDIFQEKPDEDDDWDATRNCGPWYINFVHEIEEENSRRVQEKRRAEGKCLYCGGTFTGLFTKKCARCGKRKDYDEV